MQKLQTGERLPIEETIKIDLKTNMLKIHLLLGNGKEYWKCKIINVMNARKNLVKI